MIHVEDAMKVDEESEQCCFDCGRSSNNRSFPRKAQVAKVDCYFLCIVLFCVCIFFELLYFLVGFWLFHCHIDRSRLE